MPLRDLSDEERLRLAELIKAPLILNPSTPRTLAIRWPKWAVPRSVAAKYSLLARHRPWIAGAATAVACLSLVAAVATLADWRSDDQIRLQARESRGQLNIRWDANAEPVRRATNAKLYITDGSQHLLVNLDRGRLHRGWAGYERQTERVSLRIALTEPDGQTIEREAIFYGPPVPEKEEPQLAAGDTEPQIPSITVPVTAPPEVAQVEHRSRRKPTAESGTSLPFTCLEGDIFHKTDAPPGWDTFTCKGRNVWSVNQPQTSQGGTLRSPVSGAATLTGKPAGVPST